MFRYNWHSQEHKRTRNRTRICFVHMFGIFFVNMDLFRFDCLLWVRFFISKTMTKGECFTNKSFAAQIAKLLVNVKNESKFLNLDWCSAISFIFCLKVSYESRLSGRNYFSAWKVCLLSLITFNRTKNFSLSKNHFIDGMREQITSKVLEIWVKI